MNAEQARKLTQEALSHNGAAVGPLLSHVHKRIEAIAKGGGRELSWPLTGIGVNFTDLQEKAAMEALRQQGYEVTLTPGINSEDQRERVSYYTVKW
jgi:replicative DNA helicase